MENKNQIFDDIDRREVTEAVFDEFFLGSTVNSDELNIEDIQKSIDLDNRPVFLEGVVCRLQQLGFKCDITDKDLILAEIRRRYKERLGFRCPKTVEKWIRGTTPGVTNRKNNYDLCFALEMDLRETKEFFLKHYLTMPFNYKDRTDAIFFYCLSHQKPYSVIERMMSDSTTYKANDINNTATLEIGRHILEIDNDDEFMQYLSAHCYNKKQQYQRARVEIKSLIKEYCDGTIANFEEKVMGFNYQKNQTDKMQKVKELPRRFTESLPQQGIFGNILKGKEVSYETLRKTLVILKLYDFYINREEMTEPDKNEIIANLLDFYDEVNLIMSNCGFAQLYERHPFDCLILYCANHPNPIYAFYSLNDMRYEKP